jgi:uncharacterized damage-inducible protein DinB
VPRARLAKSLELLLLVFPITGSPDCQITRLPDRSLFVVSLRAGVKLSFTQNQNWRKTMPLNQALLPEFDHEMANTRKSLERVPDNKLGWKPHNKSMSMGGLATHLATINHWAEAIIAQDSFDVSNAPPQPEMKSNKEIVDTFDKNTAAARKAIAGAADDALMKPWSLLSKGQNIFTLPRIAVLRSFIMNHTIHHRAQLGVYLRLNDIPVPSIYGPSADEGNM